MNDEIVVKFGGDLGPLDTALRGVKGKLEGVAHSIKDSFKESFRTLFAPLSVAGAFEAVRSLMEEVKNIKRISESTGLDTGITQDLLNLGKASGVASDQIESMMDKFVKNLSPGSDPEDALMGIADKLASIQDPAERARIATDAFGKSGLKLIPILKDGADGVRRMADEWGKMSDEEIATIEHADHTLDKAQQKAKVGLANAIERLSLFHKQTFKEPWWKTAFTPWKVMADAEKEDAGDWSNQPDTVSSKALPTPKELAKKKVDAGIAAAKELAEKEAFIRMKPEEKVLEITRQILALRREIALSDDPKKQEELGQKMVDLEEKRHGIQQKISQDAKTTAANQKKNSEDILKTQEQIAKLGRDKQRAQMDEYMPSLQEVANSGYSFFQGNRWQYQQGPFAQMAQRLLRLQGDAKESLIWGNKDRFKRDVSRIDELKKSLTEAGVMSPDDKLTSIDDKLKDSNQHLSDLNEKAKTGFVVKGEDDDA